ncbi:MAG: hypothetical protein QOI56_345 [Actinomycetota bacterium]|nr:hypothetical protein [Actinomycetota bacterium]
MVLLLAALLVACSDSTTSSGTGSAANEPTSPPTSNAAGTKFACFDFLATVTQGPSLGRSWSGDLVLTPDETGAFTGLLVPAGAADHQTLEVRDPSGAICRAVGQRNGAQVSWFLYCRDGSRIFGTGQVTAEGDAQQLRGIINGPTDADFGVYHGRNYPPFIRIISPQFN